MSQRKVWPVLLVLALGTAAFSLTAVPAAGLWPPVVALALIVLTKNAQLGLLVGSFAGAVMIQEGNLWTAYLSLFADHLVPSLQSPWKIGAIAFTLILGGFAAILEAGGGLLALLKRLSRPGREPARGVEMAAGALGLLCFFDGLANSMVVGRVSRELGDRSGVARVKLAYIVDSTSSAVACVAFISTWIAFQLAMIGEAYSLAGREVNPYLIFLRSLPYNFHSWFTLVLLFVAIRFRFHPGPMAGYVAAARRQDRAAVAAVPDSSGRGPSVMSAALPLGVLLVAFVVGFLVVGDPTPGWPHTAARIAAAFGSEAGPQVLVLAGLIASLTAWLVFPRGTGSGSPSRAFLRGAQTMIAPVGILLVAWMMGSVMDDLGTAQLISGALAGSGVLWLMPTLTFLTGAAISFATGTSWGTMGLLFPLAVPATAALGGTDSLLAVIVGAVFSGAVFGDHCSPFSDTTIVSSISCGVEPHEHVRTQIPYALIAAAVAVFTGFLPAGLGVPAWLSLVVGVSVLLALPAAPRIWHPKPPSRPGRIGV